VHVIGGVHLESDDRPLLLLLLQPQHVVMFHKLEIVSNSVCDIKPDEALGKAGELFSGPSAYISLINTFSNEAYPDKFSIPTLTVMGVSPEQGGRPAKVNRNPLGADFSNARQGMRQTFIPPTNLPVGLLCEHHYLLLLILALMLFVWY
jgi:hypothetical protein